MKLQHAKNLKAVAGRCCLSDGGLRNATGCIPGYPGPHFGSTGSWGIFLDGLKR